LLADPPVVDAVLMEGTRIGRPEQAGDQLTECDVENRLCALADRTDGALLVLSAAQNIDRLVSVYRAARRARRTLIVDLYTAAMARATGRATIPQAGSHDMRVYVPQRQRVLVKQSRDFERVRELGGTRIYREDIAAYPQSFVLFMQPSTVPELIRGACLPGATAVWSMWSGYLDQMSGVRTARLLTDAGIALHRLHASGHATAGDLRALGKALGPARVVPIHTGDPAAYEGFFRRVERHADGEWWEL
jgi:ribonuclease J